MSVSTWVILTILALNVLAIVTMIFWERKSPSSTLIWVLTFALLPLIGFILYLFIGNGARFGRHKQYLKKTIEDENYIKEFENQVHFLNSIPEVNKDIMQLVHFNLCQCKSLCTVYNSAELYIDMEKFFKKVIDDIRAAKESIHLEYFIFKNDELGKKIRDELILKAKEGIKVRVVYDDLGTLKTRKSFFKKLKKAGGEVARFFASKIRLLNINMNYRNHRKLIIIDNKISYTGGANIGNEYLGLHKRIKPWRDTNIRMVGDVSTILNIRFLSDFSFAMKKDVDIKALIKDADNSEFEDKQLPIQFVVSGPDTPYEEIESAYIKAIYGAKQKIFLQSPYFIPDTSFMEALKNAALSGVEIHLMIPKVPDKKYVYYATISYAKQLLKYGIKVHLFHGFIHSKTLLVDDAISSVGTFNLDMRSFKLHFEDTVFIYDYNFANTMNEVFLTDIETSTELTEEYVRKRPWLEKFLEKIMRLLTPLF